MIRRLSNTLLKLPFKSNVNRFYMNQNNQDNVKDTSSDALKTQEIISKNVGMNQFLMRTYNTTSLSIVGALSSAYISMSMPFVLANMGGCSIAGFLMTLGGFVGASMMKPIDTVENVNGVEIFKTTNTPLRLGLYSMGVMGLGLGATPLFLFANAVNPTIIPTALGLTTAIFGGASLVAYNMPKDKMLGYGGVLSGSLLGLIGLQLVGLLVSAFNGPNAFSSLLMSANNYIGIGIFTAFIAFDTHLAIKMY